MIDIVIVGAGISGLTLAHELSKIKKYNISVFEKDSIPGGMARSLRDKNNIPSEHSWRGFGPFYNNLYKILKEIPFEKLEQFTENTNKYTIDEIKKHNKENDLWVYHDNNVYNITNFIEKHPGGSVILNSIDNQDLNSLWDDFGVQWHKNIIDQMSKIGTIIDKFENKKKTVYDNLNKEKINFYLFNNTDEKYIEPSISNKDLPFLYYSYLKVISSDKRKDIFFKIKLNEYLKNKITQDSYKYIIDFLSGPGYGFDKNNLSLAHFCIFIEHCFNSYDHTFWKTFNGPINEVWFNPWVKFLKKNGVKFYFNNTLTKINYSKNLITSLEFSNNNNDNKIVYSDNFILSINPNNCYDIFKNSNLINLSKKFLKLSVSNNQISFRLGFKKKINFDKKYTGIILYDSPYNITLRAYDNHWDDKYKLDYNGNIKSLWSGTLVTTYVKGSLFKKTATSLDKKDLIKEIIHQIKESKQFINYIENNNDFKFSENDIIHTEIFQDWYFKDNRLISKNKKWINTNFNEDHRPSNFTNFENFYISGSHTKTSTNLWLMESSVESSLITCNLIFKKYNDKILKIYEHKSKFYFKLLKYFDNILYNYKIINILDMLLLIIIILIIYYIYKKY